MEDIVNKHKLDIYKQFNINRNSNIKDISAVINERMKEWRKCLSNAVKGTEEHLYALMLSDVLAELNTELRQEKNLERYNRILDQAYQKGIISDEQQAELADLIAQAELYFRESKFELAAEFADKAIEANPSVSRPYEIMADCCYIIGEYEDSLLAAKIGMELFKENTNFEFKFARLSIT